MKTQTRSQTPLLAWGLLVFLALIWGSSFFLTKKALAVYSSVEVAGGRLFWAALVLSPIIFRYAKTIPRERYPYILLCSMTGYIVPAFLFSWAGAHLNSSLSGMLNSLSPLFTLVIGHWFFAYNTRKNQVYGIVLGLIGALLLVFTQQIDSINLFDPYALLPVLGTVLYGININMHSKYLSQLPAIPTAAAMFLFTGSISLIVLSFTGFFGKFTDYQNINATATLVVLGIMSSGVGIIAFNRLVQLSSGLFASSVTYLIPIVAIGWGLLDHENIVTQQYIGMAVILTGVYLVNKK